MSDFNTSDKVAQMTVDSGVVKANLPVWKMSLLGIMAGVFIALGAAASNVAMHDISNVGLARMAGGAVFPVGLMLIVLLGAELFTGNTMMLVSVIDKKITVGKMLRNWIIVYLTNFVGSIFVVLIAANSGQFQYTDGALGAFTIKVALGKVNLTPVQAILSGILCNIFVCGAVMAASAAKDVAGKCIAIFFTIFVFVVSGYEHSVANMYYLTAGYVASKNETFVEKAKELYGITAAKLDGLNIGSILIDNLLPVTIGNIIGGGIVVGVMYYFIHVRKNK